MFKKLVSLTLITSQLAAIQFGFASSPSQAVSPELTLIETSIALQGQNLSQSDMQKQMAQAYATYAETSTDEGRSDRMEQALVSLQIYNPEQAHALMSQAMDASAQAAASGQISQSSFTAMQSKLLQMNAPQGAQFTGCKFGEYIGFIGAGVSYAGLMVWLVGINAGGEAPDGSDLPNPTIDHIGQQIAIWAGVAAVDGIVIYAFSDKNGCN